MYIQPGKIDINQGTSPQQADCKEINNKQAVQYIIFRLAIRTTVYDKHHRTAQRRDNRSTKSGILQKFFRHHVVILAVFVSGKGISRLYTSFFILRYT